MTCGLRSLAAGLVMAVPQGTAAVSPMYSWGLPLVLSMVPRSAVSTGWSIALAQGMLVWLAGNISYVEEMTHSGFLTMPISWPPSFYLMKTIFHNKRKNLTNSHRQRKHSRVACRFTATPFGKEIFGVMLKACDVNLKKICPWWWCWLIVDNHK